MQSTKFSLGQVVVTAAVNVAIADDPAIAKLVPQLIARHHAGDWGDLEPCDKKENEFSLTRKLRLFSSYNIPGDKKIWIITEADRSSTCVLFPKDY
ncbi:MAG TPA: hypothetical protein VMW64_00935 [Dehalococcoidia bacterium]|nr:hypothetical protein [Dehalococcoidia bacterium]